MFNINTRNLEVRFWSMPDGPNTSQFHDLELQINFLIFTSTTCSIIETSLLNSFKKCRDIIIFLLNIRTDIS